MSVADSPDYKSARVRIEDAIREIGVLLIALAPLDAAFAERGALSKLLIFLLIGGTLFSIALWLERTHADDRHD